MALQMLCATLLAHATVVHALVNFMGTSTAQRSAVTADVVVIGSTPGAIAAAVAASRGGATTLLVDCAPRLGGMMTGGLGRTDTGDTYAIGGIAMEVFQAIGVHYNVSKPVYSFEPHVAQAVLTQLMKMAGVMIVRSGAVAGASHAGSRLLTVSTVDGQSFNGTLFIDGTYEGDLMRASGASYAVGREANTMYGESWAGRRNPFMGPFDFRPINPLNPDGSLRPLLTTRLSAPLGSADATVQGYNFRLCATQNESNRVPFPAPASVNTSKWVLLRELARVTPTDFTHYVGLGPLPNGKYDMNNGCLISTDATGLQYNYPLASPTERVAIAEAHRQHMLEYFHELQTDPDLPAALRNSSNSWGLCADEFVENGGWPEQLYVREAARLQGDRVLKQQDLWPAVDYGNASIGMGSYPADGHYSTRGPCIVDATNSSCRMATTEAELAAAAAAGTLWTGGEGYVGATNKAELYQIPYFTLLPKRAELTNFLCPLTPSASHVTYASLRMEPQFMILGQAAGTAAAIAVARGVAAQDVPLPILHAALRQAGVVLCHEGAPECNK